MNRDCELVQRYYSNIAIRHSELFHHGIKGQKWGIKNGPPYPLKNDEKSSIIKKALEDGIVSKQINREKQLRHTKNEHIKGRSYINGDLDFAQKLVDRLSESGKPVFDSKGNWKHKERVTDSETIGIHVDDNGHQTETNKAIIIYSKSGSHIYPRKDEEDD